jgi:hypothetical protein
MGLQHFDDLILQVRGKPARIEPVTSFTEVHFIMGKILAVIFLGSVLEGNGTQVTLFGYFSHGLYLG